MKKKAATLLVLVVVIFGVWLLLTKLEIINKPSAEMLLLRKTEKTLNLSKPDHRSEDDTGCHKDAKGATQCDRHILYAYDSSIDWQNTKNQLASAGWKSFEPSKLLDTEYYKAWNGDVQNPVCLSRHGDGRSSSIIIGTKTEQDCKSTIETLSKS